MSNELSSSEKSNKSEIPTGSTTKNNIEHTATNYWNEEDDSYIICPYCGEEYEPSYEETYIGDDIADCYTEDTQTFTCDRCGKKFTMYGYQREWYYHTETIDGEMTEEEHEQYE